jgi:hypothetical protein
MTTRKYKAALQAFQAKRLRRDHSDLAAESQYRLIGEFFFTELYGPHDFSARDEQARRLKQFVHVAPGLNIGDVDQVLRLLDISNQLDDVVTAWLITLNAPLDFDEATYNRAYRLANNYKERELQLELVRGSLYNVYGLARKPMIKLVLERTERLATTVGMGDIHRFLRLGYEAIQPVKDIHRFVETVYVREKDRLDQIYAD